MSNLQNKFGNKKFSIFHIEDQYKDMNWVANDIRNWLLVKVFEVDDNALVNLTSDNIELSCAYSCICYTLTINDVSDFSIVYFLTDSPVLPPELNQFIEDNRLFLLDVLRPGDEGILMASIEKSYQSIKEHSSVEDVICYTAYQGEEVDADFDKQEIRAGGDTLMLIQKSEFEQLNLHVLNRLDDWLSK